MGTEIEVRSQLSSNIEQVLLSGDLSKLNPQERLNYYNSVCASLGLNPLTQPFSYIVLNGKLQLYAKKDCTEQLRKIHGVSITKVDPRQIGDLLVVVSDASDRNGRTDSATGAVSVGGLNGEALANAMMKAETKSKRRVTLSLCGLGILDETEVDTLRDQGVASDPRGNQWQAPQETEPQNPPPTVASSATSHEPDIKPRSQRTAQPATQPASAPQEPTSYPQGQVQGEPIISDGQRKRLFAIQKAVGLSDQDVRDEMDRIGMTFHRDAIPRSRYDGLIDAVDPDFKHHQPNNRK